FAAGSWPVRRGGPYHGRRVPSEITAGRFFLADLLPRNCCRVGGAFVELPTDGEEIPRRVEMVVGGGGAGILDWRHPLFGCVERTVERRLSAPAMAQLRLKRGRTRKVTPKVSAKKCRRIHSFPYFRLVQSAFVAPALPSCKPKDSP